MRIILALACVIATFAAFATAENIYISFPGPGVTWNPGANVSIRWIINSGGNPVDAVNLDIMDGDANNAVLVKSVAVNIQAKYGIYNWVVPVDFEKRTDYFIRATGSGSKGISYFYSGRFSVNGPVWAATAPSQPWQKEETERLRRLEAARREEHLQAVATQLESVVEQQQESAVTPTLSEESRATQLQGLVSTTSLSTLTTIEPSTTSWASISTSQAPPPKTTTPAVIIVTTATSISSTLSTIISTATSTETTTDSSAAGSSVLMVLLISLVGAILL